MNIHIEIPEDALVRDLIIFLKDLRRTLPWNVRPVVRLRLRSKIRLIKPTPGCIPQ